MTKNKIESDIEKIVDDAQKKIQKIADEYRVKHLIPFCKKHKLIYFAGNGGWSFYKQNDGSSVHDHDVKYLQPISDILYTNAIGYHDCFGLYISDVTERDIK